MTTSQSIGDFFGSTKGKIVAAIVAIVAGVAGWLITAWAMVPGIKSSLEQQYMNEINLPGYSKDEIIEMLKASIEYHLSNEKFAREYLAKFDNVNSDAWMQALTSWQSILVGVVIAIVIIAICAFFVYKSKKATA